MDFGEEAFAKTKEILDGLNIRYFGAGLESENFNNPSIIEFAKKRVALFGYSCASTNPIFGSETQNGSADLKLDRIIEDIKSVRDEVDFIIIQPHWGIQEVPFPKFEDREMAHRLIDVGADLIIGHHAHVIQSHEIYRGKHIFYGLGNFIFPDLDIPTRYDGEKFTQRIVKKQEIEHRRSIVVELDERFNVGLYTVVLEGDTIKKTDFDIPRWLPNSKTEFEKRLKYYNKYLMLKRFVRRPKVPNLNHVKEFFG
jgi:poly-gamma-glutamate synthesis protein (capsule biosynthesis protein)